MRVYSNLAITRDGNVYGDKSASGTRCRADFTSSKPLDLEGVAEEVKKAARVWVERMLPTRKYY